MSVDHPHARFTCSHIYARPRSPECSQLQPTTLYFGWQYTSWYLSFLNCSWDWLLLNSKLPARPDHRPLFFLFHANRFRLDVNIYFMPWLPWFRLNMGPLHLPFPTPTPSLDLAENLEIKLPKTNLMARTYDCKFLSRIAVSTCLKGRPSNIWPLLLLVSVQCAAQHTVDSAISCIQIFRPLI